MKTSVVTIQQAKTNLSRLIQRASEGEEVIIARGSKPVARLIAFGAAKTKRQPGSWKGKLKVGPEFFEPLTMQQWLEHTQRLRPIAAKQSPAEIIRDLRDSGDHQKRGK